MARRRKPLSKRLASLGLFIIITLFVFNFNYLLKKSLILVGIADLNWTSIARIDVDMDQNLEKQAVVFAYNNAVIISANNEIKLYDEQGQMINARKITSDNTKIIGMDEYFVVADLLQGNIFILDYTGKTVGQIDNLGTIQDIISTKNNYFVVITLNNQLNVYDSDGVLNSNVQLPEGELLGLDLSSDRAQVITTILSSDKYHYNSKIITYSMKDNLMIGGHNNYSSIVYGAKVYNDHIMIVDTEGQHAYRIGDSEEYTWEKSREGELQYFEIDQNGSIYELTKVENFTDTIFKLTATTKDGTEIFSSELNHQFTKIVLTPGKVLLQNDRILEIYSSDGILLASYESNKKINDVEWLNSERLIIEYNDYTEILELAY